MRHFVVRASDILHTRAAAATGNVREQHFLHRLQPLRSPGSAEHKPGKCQSKVPNSVSSDATVPMASSLSLWCSGKGSAGGSTGCSRGSVHFVGQQDLHSLPQMGIGTPALLTLLLAYFSQGLVDNK